MPQVGYSLAGAGVPYLMNPFPMPATAAIPDTVFQSLGQQKLNTVIVSSSTDTLTAFERRAVEGGVEFNPISSRAFDIDGARIDVTILNILPSRERVRRAASLPGAVIADWTRETLSPLLTSNTYAVPPRDVMQRGASGERIFVPGTPMDHLATEFLPVPQSSDGRLLIVAAAPDATRDVNCTVLLQDQRFRGIGSVNCGDVSTAMKDQLIPLAADVTSIRVYFQGRAQEPIVLPGRLRISYHHGEAK
jgi:hypothetical protein